MTTLFISDLHLDDQRPETTATLLAFLSDEAPGADALYILGDLFEYWLGDDVPPGCAKQVAGALLSLVKGGVPCFLMHGNRDFLLGESFAEQSGVQLLPEEYIADLYGEPVLLMHGDTLCIDDVSYQQFRKMVRNPAWQSDFLSKSPGERLQIARQARDESSVHKSKVGMAIMDVNPTAVGAAFKRHNVSRMIHGHTHRPATHQLEANGTSVERIVLGDWYTQGSVLRVKAGRFELSALS
jgi:UDP-2,3-diacylglucosamine hydrolase